MTTANVQRRVKVGVSPDGPFSPMASEVRAPHIVERMTSLPLPFASAYGGASRAYRCQQGSATVSGTSPGFEALKRSTARAVSPTVLQVCSGAAFPASCCVVHRNRSTEPPNGTAPVAAYVSRAKAPSYVAVPPPTASSAGIVTNPVSTLSLSRGTNKASFVAAPPSAGRPAASPHAQGDPLGASRSKLSAEEEGMPQKVRPVPVITAPCAVHSGAFGGFSPRPRSPGGFGFGPASAQPIGGAGSPRRQVPGGVVMLPRGDGSAGASSSSFANASVPQRPSRGSPRQRSPGTVPNPVVDATTFSSFRSFVSSPQQKSETGGDATAGVSAASLSNSNAPFRAWNSPRHCPSANAQTSSEVPTGGGCGSAPFRACGSPHQPSGDAAGGGANRQPGVASMRTPRCPPQAPAIEQANAPSQDAEILKRLEAIEAKVGDKEGLIQRLNQQQAQIDRLEAFAIENDRLRQQVGLGTISELSPKPVSPTSSSPGRSRTATGQTNDQSPSVSAGNASTRSPAPKSELEHRLGELEIALGLPIGGPDVGAGPGQTIL